MPMRRFNVAMLLNIVFFSCHAQTQSIQSPNTNDRPVAFPGAEGFGKYTTGGRAGKVFIVSNLDDKGAGSFREAAEAKEKRVIAFAVSGMIHLETKPSIRGDCTNSGPAA